MCLNHKVEFNLLAYHRRAKHDTCGRLNRISRDHRDQTKCESLCSFIDVDCSSSTINYAARCQVPRLSFSMTLRPPLLRGLCSRFLSISHICSRTRYAEIHNRRRYQRRSRKPQLFPAADREDTNRLRACERSRRAHP